ncbi:MAG TPA: hypothetical protein PKY89_03590 [Deltaproteobacteria bacterium]|nr:hypothetical protein [Deltaproteobacteria bacterium]HPJ92971.1 hypothetical protein [Deltaproteobacteria bacterium]
MKRIVSEIFIMVILASAFFVPQSYAQDLPDEAFQLLAEAMVDPCSICAEKYRERAFNILNETFMPGHVIETHSTCRLIRISGTDENDLTLSCYPSDALTASITGEEQVPQVVFRFHTPNKHLVGIFETDYTDEAAADLFRASGPGTVFEGRIRLIPYKYGEGPTYNYFQQTNTVLIHCRVLQLIPVSKD